VLTGVRTAQRYPDPLRRIHYFDADKQHLRIKAFYGTSENAVKTQA
jgi:hypothetical protein